MIYMGEILELIKTDGYVSIFVFILFITLINNNFFIGKPDDQSEKEAIASYRRKSRGNNNKYFFDRANFRIICKCTESSGTLKYFSVGLPSKYIQKKKRKITHIFVLGALFFLLIPSLAIPVYLYFTFVIIHLLSGFKTEKWRFSNKFAFFLEVEERDRSYEKYFIEEKEENTMIRRTVAARIGQKHEKKEIGARGSISDAKKSYKTTSRNKKKNKEGDRSSIFDSYESVMDKF